MVRLEKSQTKYTKKKEVQKIPTNAKEKMQLTTDTYINCQLASFVQIKRARSVEQHYINSNNIRARAASSGLTTLQHYRSIYWWLNNINLSYTKSYLEQH